MEQRSGLNIVQISQLIDQTVDLIAITNVGLAEAKPRASRFLVVSSILATFLKELEEELPQCQTLVNAQYATAIKTVPGKNITEKKVQAEAEPNYSTARENKEKLDALRSWILSHIKIFDNAHVMYRQYSRD